MPGKIFYRERQKAGEGKKQPRFKLVAVADVNLKVYGKHLQAKRAGTDRNRCGCRTDPAYTR